MFERFNPVVVVLGGIVAAVALYFLFRSQFGAEARLRRRRRRNYGHTISKAKGPTVKLAANVEDPELSKN